MTRYLIDRIGAVLRFHLINDIDMPGHMDFFPDRDDIKADIDIFLLKDDRGLVRRISADNIHVAVKTVEGGLKYTQRYDTSIGRFFCFFEKGMREEFIINRVILSAFAVFQEKLNSVLLHCSAAVKNGEVLLFVAPSGGGKTTISRILHEDGLRVIDDETCLVRETYKGYVADRFPFNEREKKPEGIRVKGVYFLEKSDRNRLGKISGVEAMKRFIPEASRLYRGLLPIGEFPAKRRHVFHFLERMLKSVDHGLLEFAREGGGLSCLL